MSVLHGIIWAPEYLLGESEYEITRISYKFKERLF